MYSFFLNILLSIPKLFKTNFHYALHSEQSYEFTPVYPSLRTKSFPSPCTFDFDRDLSFEPYDLKGHSCKPHETTTNSTSIPHSSVSSYIPNRYRPLYLPHILHNFPTKHYKFLPKFDGEIKNLTYENNLQAFENFLDLFELEHVDVCMTYFSQSL